MRYEPKDTVTTRVETYQKSPVHAYMTLRELANSYVPSKKSCVNTLETLALVSVPLGLGCLAGQVFGDSQNKEAMTIISGIAGATANAIVGAIADNYREDHALAQVNAQAQKKSFYKRTTVGFLESVVAYGLTSM